MDVLFFLLFMSVVLGHLLGWGFKHLPRERWQMFAVVPLAKTGEQWQGANLTYYGFFIATGQLISLMLFLVLLGSLELSILMVSLVVAILFLFCIPAAKLIAMVVEKKRHTFTVGGASFLGILLAPWAVLVVNYGIGDSSTVLPVIPVLAALSICYTMGEGIGRLACISYGCCYGKPIKECGSFLQWLLRHVAMEFHGQTKKVAYESSLTGEKLVPIQALTSVIYVSGALIGSYLYFIGLFTSALLFTIGLTQVWRVLSEMLRADFRGIGKISAYQKMGVLGVVYMCCITMFLQPFNGASPLLVNGLQSLWSPWVIIGLQVMWGVFFLFFGRSTVTNSTITFGLVQENI